MTFNKPEYMRTYRKAYYAASKEAVLEKSRAYYAANREAVLEQMAAYRAANRDAILAQKEIWRVANPDHNRLYKASHREQSAHREATRRALIRGATGSHTYQEWLDKCTLLGNVCLYCGEAKPLTRDHKIPLTRGGSHDIANIVPACMSCNSRKGTRTAEEYLR